MMIHVSVLKNKDLIYLFVLGCLTTFAHVEINAPSAFGTPPSED